jgi:hypothetical protein
MIYNPREGSFGTRKGPIFANLILADEINRAPSKVQSALLEAMQERQVTIGDETYPLEEPFLVLSFLRDELAEQAALQEAAEGLSPGPADGSATSPGGSSGL